MFAVIQNKINKLTVYTPTEADGQLLNPYNFHVVEGVNLNDGWCVGHQFAAYGVTCDKHTTFDVIHSCDHRADGDTSFTNLDVGEYLVKVGNPLGLYLFHIVIYVYAR